MKICKNIDLVQIDVTSNSDQLASYELSYYLPKSVDWIGRKIHKILVAEPSVADSDIISPFGGKRVLTANDYATSVPAYQEQGIYFDLYKQGGEQIARNLSVTELLSQNPNPYIIDEVLDLDLCRIHIPGKYPFSGSMLLYIFYDEVEQDSLPTNSITVRFPLAAGERMTFQELVNNYVHIQPNRIRGIIDWTERNAPCYLMLRDFNGRTILNNVLTCLFRSPSGDPDSAYPYGTPMVSELRHQLYLPCADINFDYSYVQNARNAAVEKIITFEY